MCNRGAAGSGKPNEGVLRQGSADPHTTANARIHDFGCGMAGTNQRAMPMMSGRICS